MKGKRGNKGVHNALFPLPSPPFTFTLYPFVLSPLTLFSIYHLLFTVLLLITFHVSLFTLYDLSR